jgi:hypothetical protein
VSETVAPDGESLPDRGSRRIAPTIVRDVDDRMRIPDEEIFGPVLVVREYSQQRAPSTTSISGPRRWSRTGMGPTMTTSEASFNTPQWRSGAQ